MTSDLQGARPTTTAALVRHQWARKRHEHQNDHRSHVALRSPSAAFFFAHPHLKSLARILLLDCRVDFRDVSAGELDDNGFTLAGFIRRHEYFHARSFGFRKRVR
jgi:hypothetical protein